MAIDIQNTEQTEQAKTAEVPAQTIEHAFADGVAAVWVRNGILKLDLYQSAGMTPDSKGEYRRLSQRVSMPLSGLVEFKDLIGKLEAALAENKPN